MKSIGKHDPESKKSDWPQLTITEIQISISKVIFTTEGVELSELATFQTTIITTPGYNLQFRD